ncbi:MAG: hypothetical protein JNG83_09900 [Opitutaceae bacterium]|nr:hypothetical protein [Opitutaceae bacterium]
MSPKFSFARLFACVSAFLLAVAAPAGDPRLDTAPEVMPDGRVTFRLRWPQDARVELVARGDVRHNDFPVPVYEMTRGADRIWSVTVGPLLPGLHLYRFRVDGVEIVDPANISVQPFFRGPWSRIEVPDPEPTPWMARPDVPHGRVEIRRFGNQTVGWERPVYVYLPPGFREGQGTLPVLYLLHGSEYNESDWVENGRVPVILDNLIAEGRARPMVVVMPLGYSRLPIAEANAQPDEFERWSAQVLGALLPWVEETYGTAPDRRRRAVAGLSMGGHQALRLALGRPELFAWAGAFSSGATGLKLYPEAYGPALRPDAAKPALVFVGCGRGDKSNAEARKTYDLLTAAGLRTEWREVEGRHTWRVWRQCFADLAQRLFQDAEGMAR